MSELKERLQKFIETIGYTPARFQQEAKLSNGFIDKVGHSLREESLKKILDTFSSLNKVWLLTGEGEMMKTDSSNDNKEEHQSNGNAKADAEQTQKTSKDELLAILIRSNEKLVDQNEILVHNNRDLVKNTLTLTGELVGNNSIAYAFSEKMQGFAAKLLAFQELLVDVSSKGKRFQSTEQVEAQLNKLAAEHLERIS